MLYSLSWMNLRATLQVPKPFLSRFYSNRTCWIPNLLLGKSSISVCFNSVGFPGNRRVIDIRKVCNMTSSANYAVRSKQKNYIRDRKATSLIPFDICQQRNVFPSPVEDSGKHQPGACQVLRPGMVLLKGYLTQDEQASIVSECRRLGLGPGGFYKPKNMNLRLMCLGLDWNPQTRKYSKTRRFDKVRVPGIPQDFKVMVSRAMESARAFTGRKYIDKDVEDILPMISPDVCIVNFYDKQGRLGLHQDRDESQKSLQKGLPIVSISVGDSAEFLYGGTRDLDTAKKVILESGDIVIFGGPSRHIFHGVQSIISHSAPKDLLKNTGLLPGRLNLTFRQF